jgi:quinol monooxygenase YgiN
MKKIVILLVLMGVAASCQRSAKENTTDKESVNYLVFWEYQVVPEMKENFELEYGREGSWARLFKESRSYKGSLLHRSDEKADNYLLIDIWDSKKAYDEFVEEHRETYDELSARFEPYYELETRIGAYSGIR